MLNIGLQLFIQNYRHFCISQSELDTRADVNIGIAIM